MSARLHRLANGLTVAVEPMAGVETVAVGIYADAGARSEPDGLSGLAHMVEHMVFKGAGGRSAKGIAEAIEDRGGSLNAWTARDHTVFQARLLAGDLALGTQIIADLVRSAGCHVGQGYLFSPPVDADEVRSLLGQELRSARTRSETSLAVRR